jgi:hypothetical protein
LFAQVGGGSFLHNVLNQTAVWPLPVEASGSFDWFAWQMLWIGGLYVGSLVVTQGAAASAFISRPVVVAAASAAFIFFLVWRYRLGGLWIDLGAQSALLDKWHLGALRLLNFAALAIVLAHVLLPLLARIRVHALALMGRASLPVFTVHLLVCLLSLGLIVDDSVPLTLGQEFSVLILAFGSMMLVAWRSAGASGPPVYARQSQSPWSAVGVWKGQSAD